MIRRLASFSLLWITAVVFSGWYIPTQAHDDSPLALAEPAPDSDVGSLRQLRLQFTEPVSDAQVRLVGSSTYQLAVQPGETEQIIIADVPDDLPQGRYQVVWQAVTADGHSISGTYAFTYHSDARRVGWQQAMGIAAFVIVAGIVFWLWQRTRRSAKLLAEG